MCAPGRAHEAVRQAQRYQEEGKRIIVDIALESLFDEVNHDVLEKACGEQVLPMDAIDCLVTDFRAPTAILKALRKHFDILAVKL